MENLLKTFACAGNFAWWKGSRNSRGKAGKVAPRGRLLVLRGVPLPEQGVGARGTPTAGGGEQGLPRWEFGHAPIRGSDGPAGLHQLRAGGEERRCGEGVAETGRRAKAGEAVPSPGWVGALSAHGWVPSDFQNKAGRGEKQKESESPGCLWLTAERRGWKS